MDEVITARAGETLVDIVRRVYRLSPEVRPLRVASIVAHYNQSNRLAVGNNVGHALAAEVRITCPPWKEVLARLQEKPVATTAKDTRGAMARAMLTPTKLAPNHERDAFIRALARIAATDMELAKADFGAALAKALTPKESAQLFDGGVAATSATLRAARTWLTKTASAVDASETFASTMSARFNEEATNECGARKSKVARGLASSAACPVEGVDVSQAFVSMEAARVLASLRMLLPSVSPRVFRAILQRVLAAWGVGADEWGDRFLASGQEASTPVELFLTTFDAEALDGPIAAWLWQQANAVEQKESPAWERVAELLGDLSRNDALQASACVAQQGTEILRRLRGNALVDDQQARAFLAGRNFLSIRGETRELIDRQLSLQLTSASARVAVLCLFLASDGQSLALMKADQIATKLSRLS